MGGLASRSISKPPKHYKLSIKSFSKLQSMDKFESGEFEAGGYKWKLVLFPNGNKNRDVKDHISLYLEMGGGKAIKPGKIVTIQYKLFLLTKQNERKSYLVREDSNKEEKKYCFYRTIVGGLAGFDRFIPLKEFTDASEGYLIDDRCEFGAEVFVSETTRKGKEEVLLMDFNTATYKHVWKVTNFSTLSDTVQYSEPFTADNQKYCSWKLQLYPKGHLSGKGSHVSLFLELNNSHELPPGSKILAEYTFRILDQIDDKHSYNPVKGDWFPTKAWGVEKLVTQKENATFSRDDSCIIEVEITVKGVLMPISMRHWPCNI